jgi:hypothetical protein
LTLPPLTLSMPSAETHTEDTSPLPPPPPSSAAMVTEILSAAPEAALDEESEPEPERPITEDMALTSKRRKKRFRLH